MTPHNSIRARLSRSSFVFFLLVILMGAISIAMVSYENDASAQIHDRWLQNTRYIGDFENFTSDVRADEGSLLLSSTAAEILATEQDMAALDHAILLSEQEFERIPHDRSETALYQQFLSQWASYKAAQDQVYRSFKAGDIANAVLQYRTTSREAYNLVSDTLEKVRLYNIHEASIARSIAKKTNQQIILLITAAALLTCLISFIALMYLRRSTFNPLIDLAAIVQRLARNETDLDVDGLQRTDEIGDLARAVMLFRDNIIALDNSRSKLERQAVLLLEKIEEDQQIAMHQKNFVAMASHEFRTPLHIIDGQAQRLLGHKDSITPAEIARRVGEIRGAVLRMTNLIDTLIDATRLMDGDAALYIEPSDMDMAALLRDVCRQHREISPHAQIREQFGAVALRCQGDYKLLFQAFSNIIGNSIKYNKKDNILRVSASAKNQSITVKISDNGLGIPDRDIPHLFERYYRGSNISGIVGTGLGLYLVKMVIDGHGGSITVDSKVGVGTDITVALPLTPVVASPADRIIAAP